MKFSEWLAEQPDHVQDRILGTEQAQTWRGEGCDPGSLHVADFTRSSGFGAARAAIANDEPSRAPSDPGEPNTFWLHDPRSGAVRVIVDRMEGANAWVRLQDADAAEWLAKEFSDYFTDESARLIRIPFRYLIPTN